MENANELISFIGDIERLEEEKSNITVDISAKYAAAKSLGFDPKIMREVIKLRKMDDSFRARQEEILDTYKEVLGL